MTKPPTSPSLVIVGRPNVGKSTLFNRLTGTRRSIVTDEPGITRDRIYGRAVWNGRPFEIVDTGGMLPEDKAAIPREILRQADVAIAGATGLVLVVDARAGVNPLDADLARRLHPTGKPLLIAANKVDTAPGEALAAPFYELAKEVYPVSAEHGTGVDDFLDAATRDFPVQAEPSALDSESEPAANLRDTQIAIIGRPNVGKSTLLNSLVGAERSIVSAEPGTTRDAVDTQVIRNDRTYRFIDTAGIRRRHARAHIALDILDDHDRVVDDDADRENQAKKGKIVQRYPERVITARIGGHHSWAIIIRGIGPHFFWPLAAPGGRDNLERRRTHR